MAELPLFPLRAVLYPRLPLRLHVFEPRYRALLRDVGSSGGSFGVVAIRSGEEVGGGAEPEAVGTLAVITELRELPEGRASLVVTGTQRFRIREMLPDDPYPRALVDEIVDGPPEAAALALVEEASSALERYTSLLGRITGRASGANPFPKDPVLLSWVIAASLMVDLRRKQLFLEQASVSERLRSGVQLLRREVSLLDLELANRLQIAPTYGLN